MPPHLYLGTYFQSIYPHKLYLKKIPALKTIYIIKINNSIRIFSFHFSYCTQYCTKLHKYYAYSVYFNFHRFVAFSSKPNIPPPLGEKIGLVFFSILELVVFTVKSYNQNQNKHSITATPSVIAHLDRNHAVFPVSVIIGLGSMQ